MKKLLFLMSILAMILFTSCKKNDEDVIPTYVEVEGENKQVEGVYVQEDGGRILDLGYFETPVYEFRSEDLYKPNSVNQVDDFLYKVDGVDYKFYSNNIAPRHSLIANLEDKICGGINILDKSETASHGETMSLSCEIKFGYIHRVPRYIKFRNKEYEVTRIFTCLTGYKNYREFIVHDIYNKNSKYYYCIPKFISSSLEPSN